MPFSDHDEAFQLGVVHPRPTAFNGPDSSFLQCSNVAIGSKPVYLFLVRTTLLGTLLCRPANLLHARQISLRDLASMVEV